MKKLRVVLVIGVLAILLSLVGVALAQVNDESKPEYLSADELSSRLEKAEELLISAECTLPTPAKEGLPINMGAFDNFTRTKVCIWEYSVNGITYSAWPGSASHPMQIFRAYLRLVDTKTGEIIKEVRIDTTTNGITQSPPFSLFDEYKHCGDAREYLLLLDVSARQLVNGQEIGLENRDHSWKFSFPKVPCNLYLPLVMKQQPPTPCEGWKSKFYYRGELVEVVKFAVSEDGGKINIGELINITHPDCLITEIQKNGVLKAPSDDFRVFIQKRVNNNWVSLENGDITSRAMDGKFKICCADIEWSTGLYRVIIEFKEYGYWCRNGKKLSDPPAELATKIANEYGIDYMEAYKIASHLMGPHDLNNEVSIEELSFQLYEQFTADELKK